MTTLPAFEMLRKGIEVFRGTDGKNTLQRLAQEGQRPEAIIVTCADSRVAPETIFNADVGQLFTVRVAGNVVGAAELASIEFAALALGVSSCIVIGHSRCGAVAASVDWHLDKRPPPTAALEELVKTIEPAVVTASKLAGSSADSKTVLEHATRENVRRMMETITEKSPNLKAKADDGEFVVKGCVFDIDEVNLRWLD